MRNAQLRRSLQTALISLLLLLISPAAHPPVASPRFQPPFALAAKEAVWISGPDDTVIYQKNGDTPLVPASIFKIPTAAAAFETLGPDFRFQTEFYLDNQYHLYVKGYGNPVLVSEEIAVIAQLLSKKMAQFQDLILDGSYFKRPVEIPGVSRSLNPYDASCGALNANFNTVNIKMVDGKWVSAEPQTPLLPFAQKRIPQAGQKKGRITFSQNGEDNTLYAGHLLSYFLIKAGVRQKGAIRLGKAPASRRLVLRHFSSQTLNQIVAGMMISSNNYTANQILLVMGAATAGPPASLEKGVGALNVYLKEKLGLTAVSVAEGSGISRKNRVSARAMDAVLKGFQPHFQLLKQQGRAYYKTGTLSGIQTRAGYLPSRQGGLYRFVMILNSGRTKADQLITSMVRQLQ